MFWVVKCSSTSTPNRKGAHAWRRHNPIGVFGIHLVANLRLTSIHGSRCCEPDSDDMRGRARER